MEDQRYAFVSLTPRTEKVFDTPARACDKLFSITVCYTFSVICYAIVQQFSPYVYCINMIKSKSCFEICYTNKNPQREPCLVYRQALPQNDLDLVWYQQMTNVFLMNRILKFGILKLSIVSKLCQIIPEEELYSVAPLPRPKTNPAISHL